MHWAAVVVAPCRIDGQPRPQYIAYLSGILEDEILKGATHQFWWKVQTRLDRLNLSNAARTRLELAIARKVPHPNKGERFTRTYAVEADRKANIAWAIASMREQIQRYEAQGRDTAALRSELRRGMIFAVAQRAKLRRMMAFAARSKRRHS